MGQATIAHAQVQVSCRILRAMKGAWLLLSALFLVGCGGSSMPSSPSPAPTKTPTPAPTPTFTGSVTDTVSGAPVAGYTATVSGSRVTISAPGYEPRETALASATVDLIPSGPPFDLTFYRQLARDALDEGSPDVLRVRRTPLSLYLVRGPLSDANVNALESAAREVVPALTGNRLSLAGWQVGNGPAPSGVIDVHVVADAAQPCGLSNSRGDATTNIALNAAAKCNYRGNLVDPSVLAHELGHALGFGHVSADGALMSEVRHEWGRVVVTDAERYHGAIAYHRTAGNRDIDVDP